MMGFLGAVGDLKKVRSVELYGLISVAACGTEEGRKTYLDSFRED